MQSLQKPCQNCHKPMNGGLYRASHICPHCYFEHEGGKASRRAAKAVAPEEVAPAVEPVEQTTTYEEPAYEAPVAEQVEEVVSEEVAQPAAEETVAEEVAAAEEPATEQPVVEEVVTQAPVQETFSQEPTAPEAPAEPVIEPAEVSLSTKPASADNVVANLGEVSGESVIAIELTPDMFTEGKFTGSKSEPVLAALKQGKKNALNNLRDQAALVGANTVAAVAIKNGMKLVSAQSAKVTVTASGEAYVTEASDELVDA